MIRYGRVILKIRNIVQVMWSGVHKKKYCYYGNEVLFRQQKYLIALMKVYSYDFDSVVDNFGVTLYSYITLLA